MTTPNPVPLSNADGTGKPDEGENPKRPVKKRLFVCCDGTSRDSTKEQHEATTNVSKFARCLKLVAEDGALQIVFYRKGPEDALFGKDIHDVIKDAYHFICHNYNFEEGGQDEIHLIGFSRGAFAVRALACFIADTGLFGKTGLAFLPHTYQLWRNWRESKPDQQVHLMEQIIQHVNRGELKMRLKTNIHIECCAVWDTVSALNVPLIENSSVTGKWIKESGDLNHVGGYVPKTLRNAFQALALNETRKEFPPTLWERSKNNTYTNIKQCWFRGDHSDIGGGWRDSGLANFSLLWMVSQYKISLPNVTFDDDILTDFLTPMTLDWTIDTYFEKSHTATEGRTHKIASILGFSKHGTVSSTARERFLKKDPIIHPTVRILMTAVDKDEKEQADKNPLLAGYHPVLCGKQEPGRPRVEWRYRDEKEASFQEDAPPVPTDPEEFKDWEGRAFLKWLKREHDWRVKAHDDLQLQQKGLPGDDARLKREKQELENMQSTFAARLYDFRGEISKPSEYTIPEYPKKAVVGGDIPPVLPQIPNPYVSRGTANSYQPLQVSEFEYDER